MPDPEPFADWAIVELIGRNRIAGYVTADAPLMRATRLQIDIYDGDSPAPALTQYTSYPVYRLTAATEVIARALGARLLEAAAPAGRWELEPPRPRATADRDGYVIHAYGCDDPDCDGRCDVTI